jgi:hypothetical protein
VTTWTVPDGTQLHPNDPCSVGSPDPSDIKSFAGKVWVTLANLDHAHGYAPAGPSFLLEINPATGSQTLHELTGCFNAQGMALRGTSDLLVACANDYVNPGGLGDYNTMFGTFKYTATGGAPGVVAVAGTKAYLNDATFGGGNGVMVVDLAAQPTTVLVDSAHETAACTATQYVSALAYGPKSGLWATCYDPSGGGLLGIDLAGVPVAGTFATMQGPIAMTLLQGGVGDGSSDTFGVVATTDHVVQYFHADGTTASFDTVTVDTGAGTQPNGISGDGSVAFVANSHTDELLQIGPTAVMGRVQLPAGSDPYNVAMTDFGTAWGTLLLSNQVVEVVFP